MQKSTKLIVNYLIQGYTMPEVSKILNVNYKTVEYVKRKYNITVNKVQQSKVDYHFLDNIDSDIKAYFLGFFIADGSIDKSGRITFSIAREDEYILYQFRECFKANNIVYRNYQNGVKNRKEQAIYRFTSKKLLDILKDNYNIGIRKTYDSLFKFPFEKIPIKFYGSFIRGL